MSEIKVDNISKSFGNTCVLKDISFQVKDGHLLALLGPSGCGKTTLLRIIAGLEYADEGNIFVGEKNLTPIPVEKRNIGVVFQNYALIPHMTVYNNIAYGLKIRKVPRDKIREQVEKYIALIGLEGMMDRKVTQLSGGQQQRVALARALIVEPDILLLDEPLSALDRKIRTEMQTEIRRIQQQVGITTIFVTHDQEEAMSMSDEILLMREGALEQLSTPRELYNHPVSLYASDFLGKANTLRGTLVREAGRWYVSGGGWKFEVEKKEDFHPGEDVYLAIRGEQVGIFDSPVENCAECTIKSILFTGELCRLIVDLCGVELTLSCMNIQAENLRPGQKLYFRTDPKRIHYYRAEQSGVDVRETE